MSVLYRVVDWDKLYENSRTRQMAYMRWVPFPISFDGDGYTELLSHEDGISHYGAWVAIALVAGKCEPRGTLLRGNGAPHDAKSLNRLTRVPLMVLEAALPRLVEVGWLSTEVYDAQGVAKTCQAPDRQLTKKCQAPDRALTIERNGTERNGTEGSCPEPAAGSGPLDFQPETDFVFPVKGKGPKEWTLPVRTYDELMEAYPDLDAPRLLREAQAWCRTNRPKQKTASGMPRFLNAWFAREQNRGGGGPRVVTSKCNLDDLRIS